MRQPCSRAGRPDGTCPHPRSPPCVQRRPRMRAQGPDRAPHRRASPKALPVASLWPGVKHLRSGRKRPPPREVFEVSAHLGVADVLRCPRAVGGLGRAILRVPDRLVLVGRLHTK